MRGVELPISAIILIALAIIALIALIAFLYPEFLGQSESFSVVSVKNTACMEFLDNNCDVDPMNIDVNFDADRNGEAIPRTDCDRSCGPGISCDNLRTLARCWFGCPDLTIVQCAKKLCGCPGYT